MKITITFFALSATFLLAACSTSSVTVATNYDHAASFGQYRTYTLAPPRAGEKMAAISEGALRDTLRTQLAARGIAEVSGKKADLDVALQFVNYR